ncbi:MAG: hypothetical protein K2U26_04375 [Cyclobacteriaceae bacterium]|nr:hypothetical protein [Cyclobacteriaceae bacterium]
MSAIQPNRIKSLSTRYLGFYKNSVLILLCALAITFFYSWIKSDRFNPFGILMYGQWLYFIYLWIRVNRNVYRVEFDDKFLYLILPKNDVLIPLENIKDVDIVSLGGVYRVDLYQPEFMGKKFYFKPSLLYPFNFKKKDALVDVLRKKIGEAKKNVQPLPKNALFS